MSLWVPLGPSGIRVTLSDQANSGKLSAIGDSSAWIGKMPYE